jgi:hypothetical protein
MRGPLEPAVGFEGLLIGRLQGIAVSRMNCRSIQPHQLILAKIGRAVQMGVPCFLAHEPWRTKLQISRPDSKGPNLSLPLLLLMVDWSAFAIEIRKFCAGDLPQEALLPLWRKIWQAHSSLTAMDVTIQEYFSSKKHVTEVCSQLQDSIFDTVFDFADYDFSVAQVVHACYSLTLGRMLVYLSQGVDSFRNMEIIEEVGRRRSRLLNRVCRSYEYAWKRRPLGATHMFGPLVVAFPLAEGKKAQDWILRALNELDMTCSLKNPRYTAEGISYMAGIMMGEHPPISPPNQ